MPTTEQAAAEAAAERARTERKASIAHGFDLVAPVYGTAGGDFFRSLGRRLTAFAGIKPGDRVLDLGCGRGAVLFAAADAVGPDGYAAGIDLSSGMVHATAAEAAGRGLRNVAVRVGDAEDPGFPSHSFETVTAGLMMFITPEPEAVLAAVRRVLVPGGRFAMTTLCPEQTGWQTALHAALAFQDPPPGALPTTVKGGNGRFDTLDGISATMDRAGFAEVRTVEDEHVATVADAEAWWASVWASGVRGALEKIPEQRRAEAKAAAFAVVDGLAVDGVLTRRTGVRFTSGISTSGISTSGISTSGTGSTGPGPAGPTAD